jgi:hypothetical protein
MARLEGKHASGASDRQHVHRQCFVGVRTRLGILEPPRETRTNPPRAERVRVDARRKIHTRWSGEISIATIKVVDEVVSEVMI